MNLFSCDLILVLVIGFVHQSCSKHCNEDNLKKCIDTMQILLEEQFSPKLTNESEKNENELNSYCGRVEEEGKCLQDATAACTKEHPLIAASTATLFNYLHKVCLPGSEQRLMFLKVFPCFEKNENLIESCGQGDDHKHIRDADLENVCKEMKRALCVAEVSRKVCGEDGESYAKTMEYGLKDTYKDVCNGACSRDFYVWSLICAVIVTVYFKKTML